jgi:SAM-dependent methyltransferase
LSATPSGWEPALGAPSSNGPGSPEPIVDYRRYDFRAVWARRFAVDRFDRALLARALEEMDHRRVLELGTGFGRLTPALARAAGEYVGVDYDEGMLAEAREALRASGALYGPSEWLAANAYHLPFSPGAFSSVCMIRVHHHLAQPRRVLAEIRRVLAPGGTALVSYNPWSRLRAAGHDLARLLRTPGRREDLWILKPSSGPVCVRESPLPHYVMAPSEFDRDLRAVGLEPVRQYGGVETRAARILPRGLGLAGSRNVPLAPVFSTCWVIARRPGDPGPLPAWSDLIACPRCGCVYPVRDAGPPRPGSCAACAFEFRVDRGILDARYVAPAPEVEPSAVPS